MVIYCVIWYVVLVWCAMVWYDEAESYKRYGVLCGMVCYVVWYGMYGTVWCGMIWYTMVCYVVWYGMYGTVWCGVV